MPTDVLCSTVEDLLHHHTSSHIANLHQARPHHPASDSALLDVKKNAAAAAKQQQCSQTSETTASSSSNATDNSGLLKNARSASLPLKILLNDCIGDTNNCVAANTRRTNGGRFTVSDLSQKLIRSWNGMDTFLMNKFNKSPSSSTSSSSAHHHHHDAAANGTNFILYARFSLSEHFLNVIGGDRVPLSPLDRRHREERGDVSSTSSTSSSRSSSNESTSSNSNARNTNSNNNNTSNQNTTTENFYLDDMDEEDDVDLDIDEDIDYEDEDDEIEEESSGKTGSVDSSERTASSDAVVQFDLETEDDFQPSSARIELPPAVLSCLGQQQQPDCLSDINNNDRNMKDNDEAAVEEDEAKEYDDVDEFDDDDKKQSVVSENEQSTDEAATSNNDLDQTITYEETPVSSSKEDQQLNNVVESLKNLDLEELENDNNKAVEVAEKSEYNATSSPVISSQIENEQHRSVSPISVVVDDSSNHATNFNADETLNLEDDSEVVSVDTSSGYTSNNNSMTQSSSSSSSCSPGDTPNTSSILSSSETSSPSEPLSPSQSTATITQITVDMNKTPTTTTTTTAAPKVVVEDNSTTSSRQQVNTSSASLSWSIGSSTSSMSSSAEDDAEENIFKNFMPKKSCLKKNYPNRHQLYIDTSNGGSGIFNSDNATSSPLVPATPTSPLSSSISSSPFFSSSSSSFQSPPSSSSHQSEMIRSKKRVSFADVCGKDLYTIRTMSEPSNCPPKLTSKIVQFFLNREFSNQQQNGNGFNKSPYGASSKNGGVYGDGGDFFSRTRNYGYGISTSNYSNDLNQLAGTIAVYSLNFAQPSADYFKFRQRIVDSSVSLENVMLNRFQINGTIKVKNINFHKYVFVRCSFDKWSTHQDFAAQYVPSEYYSSMMSHNSHHHQQHFHQMLSSLSSSPSFSSSSSSASAYNSTPHHHKEFDTFRFEFELPKNPSPSSPQSSTASNNRSGSTPNASIQFCICYRAGDSGEFWDNNEGKNYEILQYVIDIESLKPQSAQRTIISSSSSPSLSDTKSRGASIYSNPSRPINDPITSDIYY